MHIQEHNISSHNSFHTIMINLLPKNHHEMNKNSLPSNEQNTVVTVFVTQTEYGDEKIESPTTCDNILDNKDDFSDDEKNSTEHGIENEDFKHKNDDSVCVDLEFDTFEYTTNAPTNMSSFTNSTSLTQRWYVTKIPY